jgi:DNA polymerase III subunit beta
MAAKKSEKTFSIVMHKPALLKLLRQVGQVTADKRGNLPALANVLLRVSGTQVTATGTDLIRMVITQGECAAPATGTICLNSTRIRACVENMPDGPVEIGLYPDGHALVQSGVLTDRRYDMTTLDVADYPELPVIPTDGWIEVPRDTLMSLFSTTFHAFGDPIEAVARQTAKLVVESGKIQMSTANGRSAAYASAQVATTASTLLLLSREAVKTLNDLLGERDKSVTSVSFTKHGPWVFFRAGGFTYGAKMVDYDAAQLPHEIFFKNAEGGDASPFEIGRALLADALRAVSIAANEKTGGVEIQIASSKLVISGESSESGKATDSIAIDYDGRPMVLGVSAAMMSAALGAVSVEKIDIRCAGPLDPILILPRDLPSGHEAKLIVMPMGQK